MLKVTVREVTQFSPWEYGTISLACEKEKQSDNEDNDKLYGVFTPFEGVTQASALFQGIVEVDQGTFAVKFANFTPHKILLEPGDSVGYVEICEMVNLDVSEEMSNSQHEHMCTLTANERCDGLIKHVEDNFPHLPVEQQQTENLSTEIL